MVDLTVLVVLLCHTTNGVLQGNTIVNVPVQSPFLACVHSWVLNVAVSFQKNVTPLTLSHATSVQQYGFDSNYAIALSRLMHVRMCAHLGKASSNGTSQMNKHSLKSEF